MINIGIIGYGGMADWHRRNVTKVEGIQCTAAYDIDPNRVKAAEAEGLKGYYKLEDLLKDKSLHIILVATPNEVHKELCVAAMDAGKNVICEKPVAMNEKEVDEMIAASKRNNVLFTVHQNRRWDKDYVVMKKVFDDGLIGNVFNVESRLHGTGGVCHGWRGETFHGGGMLYDWGPHLIDQMLMMVPDKLTQVFCQAHRVKNVDVEDYFRLVLTYQSGLTAIIEVSTYSARGLPRFYANGDEGAATIDQIGRDFGGITRTLKLKEKFEPTIIETEGGPTRTFAPQPPETLEDAPLPQVQTAWTDYYINIKDVIENGAKPIVQHNQIKRAIRVIDAGFESIRTGKSVDYHDFEVSEWRPK